MRTFLRYHELLSLHHFEMNMHMQDRGETLHFVLLGSKLILFLSCMVHIFQLLTQFQSLFAGQWKFAFLSLGRPEYLQDSDIVFTRFQVLLNFVYLKFLLLKFFPIFWWLFMVDFFVLIVCTSIFSEKRCLWCLGAVPWVRAFWQHTKEVLCSKPGTYFA